MRPYVARPHTITFNKDIAPLLFEHCIICHRPGQSGPFPLLSYEDAKKRAGQIVRVTERRYMPPWLPEPGNGEFVGERRLSETEIGMLRQWASEGAAEGQKADLPPTPQRPNSWTLGKPDLVLELPTTYTLPAEGKDVYRNFILPVPLGSKRYVRGIEFQPTNPKIVHHAFINLDSGRMCRKMEGMDGSPGFPGMVLPEGADIPEGHFLGWQPEGCRRSNRKPWRGLCPKIRILSCRCTCVQAAKRKFWDAVSAFTSPTPYQRRAALDCPWST